MIKAWIKYFLIPAIICVALGFWFGKTFADVTVYMKDGKVYQGITAKILRGNMVKIWKGYKDPSITVPKADVEKMEGSVSSEPACFISVATK